MTDDPFKDMDIPRLLARVQHDDKQKKLKRQHPFLLDLIAALDQYKRPVHSSWVVKIMEKERSKRGMDIPAQFAAAVRNTYNHHCLDYAAWRKDGAHADEALFITPGQQGYWSLNRQVLLEWLVKHGGQT